MGKRRGGGRLAGGIVAVVVGAAGLFAAVPGVANAAEVPDAIRSVSIQAPDPAHPDKPLTVGQNFKVDAEWAVPDGTAPNSTFVLDFPSPITGFAATFDLKDPDGNVVGTCAVSSSRFTCTMGDFVATHKNVHGTLTFVAVANSTATGSLDFTTGAETIAVPIPGGSIGVPNSNVPTSPVKFGVVTPNGNIQWEIVVPAQKLSDGLVLADGWDGGMTFAGWIAVGHGLSGDYNNGSLKPKTTIQPGTGPDSYTLLAQPSRPGFDLTFHQPVTTPGTLYTIVYQTTPPAGTPDGTVFHNTVTGSGIDASVAVTFVRASGSGGGDTPVTTPPETTPAETTPPETTPATTPPVTAPPETTPPVTTPPETTPPVTTPPETTPPVTAPATTPPETTPVTTSPCTDTPAPSSTSDTPGSSPSDSPAPCATLVTPPVNGPGGNLVRTGSDVSPMILGASLLLVLGGAFAVATTVRRRKNGSAAE